MDISLKTLESYSLILDESGIFQTVHILVILVEFRFLEYFCHDKFVCSSPDISLCLTFAHATFRAVEIFSFYY